MPRPTSANAPGDTGATGGAARAQVRLLNSASLEPRPQRCPGRLTLLAILLVIPSPSRTHETGCGFASFHENLGSQCGSPEAIVNVHDGHPGGTAVEHSEQRRESAEVGPVTDTRRHRHHRHIDQPSNDARQCTVHARRDHDAPRGLQDLLPGEQTMNPRHAYIIQSHDLRVGLWG